MGRHRATQVDGIRMGLHEFDKFRYPQFMLESDIAVAKKQKLSARPFSKINAVPNAAAHVGIASVTMRHEAALTVRAPVVEHEYIRGRVPFRELNKQPVGCRPAAEVEDDEKTVHGTRSFTRS